MFVEEGNIQTTDLTNKGRGFLTCSHPHCTSSLFDFSTRGVLSMMPSLHVPPTVVEINAFGKRH